MTSPASKAAAKNADKAGPKATRQWWGKHELGRNVWEESLNRTETLFKDYDHVAVLFSAGKDSTVALNVTLEVARRLGKLPLRVIFGDEEVLTPDTVDYAARVAASPELTFEWYCLPWKHRNACSADSPFWYPWAPEARELWVRDLPEQAITEQEGFPMEVERRIPTVDWASITTPYKTFGRAAMVMGIRVAESMVRRRAIANRRSDNWIIEQTVSAAKAYTIYDWSVEDVWTATGKFGWDYNRTYEVFEMMGITRSAQRIAPPFGEEPRQTLWMWAKAYPDLWAKMVERAPGVAAAARYSRTDLYAFRSQPNIKGKQNWQDYIRLLIARQPAELQAGIAHDLRKHIAKHYRETTDPILDTVMHPASGLSWAKLAQLAEEGNLKGRQRTTPYAGAPGSPAFEKLKLQYQEALKEWDGKR